MRIIGTTALVACLLTSACTVYKNSGRKQFESQAHGQIILLSQCWLPLSIGNENGQFNLCLTGVKIQPTEKP